MHQSRGYSSVVLIIIVSFILFGLGFFLYNTIQKKNSPPIVQEKEIEPKVSEKTAAKKVETTFENEKPEYSLKSPASIYQLNIFWVSGNCSYSVEDISSGSNLAVSDSGNKFYRPIECDVLPYGGPSGFLSNRVGWLDDSKFFLNSPKNSDLLITTVNDLEIGSETISYKDEYAGFIGISRDTSRIMWAARQTQGSEDKSQRYIVTDSNLEVLKTINFTSKDRTHTRTVFAPANNGVLYIEHFETDDFESVNNIDALINPNDACQCKPGGELLCNLEWSEFTFLDFTDLTIHPLLKSSKKLSTVCGRGCYGPEIKSSDGDKIFLDIDCFSVDEKFYNEDRLIELNLP